MLLSRRTGCVADQPTLMTKSTRIFASFAAALTAVAPLSSRASSHMDAPLITLDPSANTTDVYAFVSTESGQKYLTTALAVYPFEEPGIGPNNFKFDENVIYQINVARGADIAAGLPTVSYRFRFRTITKNRDTVAQAFLNVIEQINDAGQNLTQHYSVFKRAAGVNTTLFADALVPPNNQGRVTPYYNQGDNGESRAREGVAVATALDRYTAGGTFASNGYRVFAGQRDDGFFADIQSIFDLDFSFSGPNKPFDSQGGFNVHTIVFNIPMSEIGGDQQVVGVWADTLRPGTIVLSNERKPQSTKPFVQVARQGNPLFCEALVPIRDKDRYNRTPLTEDASRFQKYALAPELATLLGVPADRRKNRTDLAAIFIPDMLKVDLSTGPARLAGGTNAGAAPDDAGFSRLGIFGNDTLKSKVQSGFGNGTVPGGWPNGRRFGDDVLDIAVIAIKSDLRTSPPMLDLSSTDIDRVTKNDIGYNKVLPYAATPQNGRNHPHHGKTATAPSQ